MTYTLSQFVLEAGVVAVFCALTALAAVAFSRRVIGRYGAGWVVGVLILAGAAVVSFGAMWGADRAFVLLDPRDVIAPPDTGSAVGDLILVPAHILAQVGAGFEHLYGVLVAAGVSAMVWLGVTGTAALRFWRRIEGTV
ncbi:hypothetical protein [Tabrizicola sp.]|uniref:hypothetical protein n=1 Tax=Tabrizicola sp. TaxID=2005166 RepID=UPI003F3967C0